MARVVEQEQAIEPPATRSDPRSPMPALLRRFLLAPLPRLVWTGILAWVLVRLMFWVAPTVMRASNVTLTGSIRNAIMTVVVFAAGLWLFERRRPRDDGLGVPDLPRFPRRRGTPHRGHRRDRADRRLPAPWLGSRSHRRDPGRAARTHGAHLLRRRDLRGAHRPRNHLP